MSTPPAKPPEILDKIVDLVLAHKPKAALKEKKIKHKKKSFPKPAPPKNS
jgi:hypothetical protein